MSAYVPYTTAMFSGYWWCLSGYWLLEQPASIFLSLMCKLKVEVLLMQKLLPDIRQSSRVLHVSTINKTVCMHIWRSTKEICKEMENQDFIPPSQVLAAKQPKLKCSELQSVVSKAGVGWLCRNTGCNLYSAESCQYLPREFSSQSNLSPLGSTPNLRQLLNMHTMNKK